MKKTHKRYRVSTLPKRVRSHRKPARMRAAAGHARTSLPDAWKGRGEINAHLALSLARGYTDLYYVNIDTDEFIEFHTDDVHGVLTEVRRGDDFFEGCRRDVKLFVHPDDEEKFLRVMDEGFLKQALVGTNVYELVYRRIVGDDTFYVDMKISRMEDDPRLFVLAVEDIDEKVRQRKAEERMQEERIVYARLHALTGNFIVIYVVDPETDEYREFSSTEAYEQGLAQAKAGADFFGTVRKAAAKFNDPADLGYFLEAFTKDNVMAAVEDGGVFTLGYRLMMEDSSLHCQMKAAMVEEPEGLRLVVGLNDIDAQVRAEEEITRKLAEAQALANIDALTGVKNKHAYLEAEALIDRRIREHRQEPFAVSIFDLNDLKETNDTEGHQAGDELIRNACKVICDTFCHSPVFRVGGDEFAVISQGPDYEDVEDLVWKISSLNTGAIREGGIVIACGMSKFANDTCVAEVFERADQDMYANKNELKVIANEILGGQADGTEAAGDGSRYDYLTGLPTLSAFLERCNTTWKARAASGKIPTMLFFDIAGMKFVNTKHGFAEGDRVLKELSLLLIRSFGRENCCRIGADHFAVETESEGVEPRLERIFREFALACEGKTPPVRVGIYANSVEDIDPNMACDRAQLACSTIKNVYASEFAYYDDTLREQALMRQYIVENFERACEERWIKAYLQPIIRGVNECVCDAEMLARWHDPERGVLSPPDFIPALEDAGLIWKLDLYMVERVLDAIHEQIAEGFTLVPHSINFSRIDFDACDVVEEVRRRVDDSGIERKWITIEITESVIGSNMEFMKEQVRRFQELGFEVWMDDFGSGYSSLDVLQSIKFDTLKFDLSFMRKFDENEESRIVLTELVRMASALGVDTLCEGVETEEQMRFLQEIGCTKMQGYYFRAPVPFEKILEKHKEGTLHQNEDERAVRYLESIGRVNLHDFGSLVKDEKTSIENSYNTVPMGVIEIRGDTTRWVRSNASYRSFVKQKLGFELSQLGTKFVKFDDEFMCFLAESFNGNGGQRVFYDQQMPDGSVVHSFARLIDTNPVDGTKAIVVAVLSINEPTDDASYSEIARALASDYRYLYIVDLSDDSYIEYSPLSSSATLSLEKHGNDFFASAARDARVQLDARDQDYFIASFTKENVLADIEKQGAYTITYRLIEDGAPIHVHMKVTKLDGAASKHNRLIIGVNIIESQIRQQQENERLQQETSALSRIAALSEDFIALYAIEVSAKGEYVQYNARGGFEDFNLAEYGTDFWADVVSDAPKAIPECDIPHHLEIMSKDNVMGTIRSEGRFIYDYRMIMDGKIVPARLKAVIIEENGREKIILGVTLRNGEGGN